MKTILLLSVLLFSILHVYSLDTIVWEANQNPIILIKDFVVEPEQLLVVKPGVIVQGDKECLLRVQGRIKAIGTANQPIRFMAMDSCWGGITLANFQYQSQVQDTFIHCIFTGGKTSAGGALKVYYGNVFIENCSFFNNEATQGIGQGDNHGGAIMTTHSIMTLNQSVFDGNAAAYAGGAISFSYGEAIVKNCIISNNTATNWGGGIIFGNAEKVIFENNLLEYNHAENYYGGGIYLFSYSGKYNDIMLNRNIIRENIAPTGGAIAVSTEKVIIANTLLINNQSSGYAAIRLTGGEVVVYNSTIVSNSGAYPIRTNGGKMSFYNTILALPTFDYLENFTFYSCFFLGNSKPENADENSLTGDPSFISGAFSLSTASPCVNKGKSNGLPNWVLDKDLAGNNRSIGTIDIGAYESQTLTSGFNQLSETNSLFLYPNPAKDYIFIQSGGKKIFDINVQDATGQKVYMGENENVIPLRHLARGLYWVSFNIDNRREVDVFLKE